MTLTRLRELHTNMKANGITRCRFKYTYRILNFDVFFLTDESPYILMFGIIGQNVAFKVNVRPGYNIDTHIPTDIYNLIFKLLGLTFDKNNPFNPSVIFEHFNQNMNVNINKDNQVKAHQLAPYYSDVEESDKIYFLGWRNNTVNEHVGEKNLDKTRKLLGIEVYNFSKKHNVSTKWTDDQNLAKNFYYLKI
ncbi:MAG: DUF6037 family protein [Thiovulaceae bacterium]|nr:DUF6037 family protein [Sulfurimonadaceae bacterium]